VDWRRGKARPDPISLDPRSLFKPFGAVQGLGVEVFLP
jgi:hypothetical protein